MFNNKKSSQTYIEGSSSYKTEATIIGSSSSFNGTLNSAGVIRVDGSFEGELNVEGSIIVGENGIIKGNIKASKVTIAGRVEGNISCNGTLELTSSGRLYGDIEVKTINIEDGAVFEGKCMMMQSSSKHETENTGTSAIPVNDNQSVSN